MDLLKDIQNDLALYSVLKDELQGKDEDTDLLLDELQDLQIDIIKILSEEVMA